jgi:hypothetical protein
MNELRRNKSLSFHFINERSSSSQHRRNRKEKHHQMEEEEEEECERKIKESKALCVFKIFL